MRFYSKKLHHAGFSTAKIMLVVSVLAVASLAHGSTVSASTSFSDVVFYESEGTQCMGINGSARLTPILAVPLGSCSVFQERSASGGIEVRDGSYDIGFSGGEFKLETPSASTVLVIGPAWSIGGHSYNALSVIGTSDYASFAPDYTPLGVIGNPAAKSAWRWPGV